MQHERREEQRPVDCRPAWRPRSAQPAPVYKCRRSLRRGSCSGCRPLRGCEGGIGAGHSEVAGSTAGDVTRRDVTRRERDRVSHGKEPVEPVEPVALLHSFIEGLFEETVLACPTPRRGRLVYSPRVLTSATLTRRTFETFETFGAGEVVVEVPGDYKGKGENRRRRGEEEKRRSGGEKKTMTRLRNEEEGRPTVQLSNCPTVQLAQFAAAKKEKRQGSLEKGTGGVAAHQ